jgi:protein-disulfide isomerase
MASKEERQEEARAARLEGEQADRDERARKRRLQLGLIAGFALLVVVAIIVATQVGGDDEDGGAGTGTEAEELLSGIPQDGTVLGEPDAPFVLTEVADLQCPFCAQFSNDVLPAVVEDFVRPGDLRIDLRLLTFIGPDAEEAARMALALAPQDSYWNFVDLFYANQGAENSGYVDEDFLRGLVDEIPDADFDEANAETGSAAVTDALAEAAELAEQNGINSTPSFLIARDGQEPRPFPIETLDPGDFTAALEDFISANR